MSPEQDVNAGFWAENQPGFKFTNEEPGTSEFFEAIESHRYSLEPHIPGIARFERWGGKDVLEVGCGIATDGTRFARAGAIYTGFDGSKEATALARQRFKLEGLEGTFVNGDATSLPFADSSFDLVYSHGVIHHFKETEKAVDEFRRVLRPGGEAIVMLYHRSSFNYHFTIMFLRRFLAALLLLPGADRLIAEITGEDVEVLDGHKVLLADNGLTYLTDRELFLSNNTDGPGNPLSKVYTAEESKELFAQWNDVETTVRFLNLRVFPAGGRLAKTALAERLGRRWGWHLYIKARS